MPDLEHAARTLPRATYTPIKKAEDEGDVKLVRGRGQRKGKGHRDQGRAWEKWSLLAQLRLTGAEDVKEFLREQVPMVTEALTARD